MPSFHASFSPPPPTFVFTRHVPLHPSAIEQTKHLCGYVLKLAKYDQNYDIRDKARLVTAVLYTKVGGGGGMKRGAIGKGSEV